MHFDLKAFKLNNTLRLLQLTSPSSHKASILLLRGISGEYMV